MAHPVLGDHFHQHPSVWNRDTALGAALFGVGWGLCGVCPGLAIAGLGTGDSDLLWALGDITLGALAQAARADRAPPGLALRKALNPDVGRAAAC